MIMKSNLLLVSNMYPDADNPTHGIFVKDIYESFNQQHYDKYKCVLYKQSDKYISKILAYLIFQVKILLKLISVRFDYVYCHYVSHVLFIPVFLKYIGFKFKLIGHVHGSDVHCKPDIVFRLLNYCDIIVVPSEAYRLYLLDRIDYHHKIVVSPSGGIKDNCFTQYKKFKCNTVGFVGRLVSVKRPDRFKKFILHSTNNKLPFNFKVFGSGKLEEIFLNTNLPVEVYPPVHRDELPQVFTEMGFILITSDRESLCLVALEAMANGVVVIANNCGGVSDYIVDGVNGFIVDMSLDNWELQVALILNIDECEYIKISKAAFNTSILYKSSDVSKRLISNVFS